MDRIPVTSSNIQSIGFDASNETLEIEFISGSTYQYYGVPEHVYEEMMSASSHGKYFHAHIKGRYPESKM